MTERASALDSAACVRVLHRDDDLLVLYKPSGLPTTSPDGKRCLTEVAAKLDPDAPRLHASSRLDAEVTGLVTFARTTRAIEALLHARSQGRYERFYLALTAAAPEQNQGSWTWPIDRDPRDPRKRVARDDAARSMPRAREALTHYHVLSRQPLIALWLLRPMTGRTHQLRVHAARAGFPLLGDRHYGGAMQRTLNDGRVLRAPRVMLHCAHVRVPAPERGGGGTQLLDFEAEVPDDFRRLWLALGGEPEALRDALAGV